MHESAMMPATWKVESLKIEDSGWLHGLVK